MLNVKPTKMELLKLKKKEELAKKSHKLLKRKYEVLAIRLMNILKEFKEEMGLVNDGLEESYGLLAKAKIIMGEIDFSNQALVFARNPTLDVSKEVVLGVTLPRFSYQGIEKIEFSEWKTPISFDRAAIKFQGLLGSIVSLAEKKNRIDILSSEIESTKRKVNALEHKLLPMIQASIRYIEFTLEERAREDFVRYKRIKDIMRRI